MVPKKNLTYARLVECVEQEIIDSLTQAGKVASASERDIYRSRATGAISLYRTLTSELLPTVMAEDAEAWGAANRDYDRLQALIDTDALRTRR